ncbi:MAG TPA: deoxyribonuclease IV [Candidatus Pelethenecus faecipullorum]|uniref:Probable endonuclease 4 n=1 Tax=Candidatus Pelethenecus faecipullorum TaxID=2840900 RepID=A0A9D1GQJ6_9MOLU|nr:deoxyribonuclease IV [Candidatus Pelethenecus faecipullorum]
MFKIGCHLSIGAGFLKAAKTIVSLGGNTYQYFSRNPQGGKAKAWDQNDFDAFMIYAKENGIDGLLCHAPYTLNACSANPSTREFAKMVFTSDIAMLEHFPNALYNFHPGSHTGQGVETGIEQITEILNEVLYPEMKTTVLLECMAGKGSEIGRSFEEIAEIIAKTKLKDKLGVCLDTCHVYSAGYDIVGHLDAVLEEFDAVIGLDRLKAIHLNDSKMPFASNKDRHEKIGEGTIGKEAILKIINHPLLKDLPFYLETPNDEDGYAKEIAFLKENRTE